MKMKQAGLDADRQLLVLRRVSLNGLAAPIFLLWCFLQPQPANTSLLSASRFSFAAGWRGLRWPLRERHLFATHRVANARLGATSHLGLEPRRKAFLGVRGRHFTFDVTTAHPWLVPIEGQGSTRVSNHDGTGSRWTETIRCGR